jgi:hypothetical protein
VSQLEFDFRPILDLSPGQFGEPGGCVTNASRGSRISLRSIRLRSSPLPLQSGDPRLGAKASRSASTIARGNSQVGLFRRVELGDRDVMLRLARANTAAWARDGALRNHPSGKVILT